MSAGLRLTTSEYDHMVACGAFEVINRKVELLRGEIVEMSPAGPIHDDVVHYLLEWSFRSTERGVIQIRVQSGVALPELDSRPEPDIFWVKAKRYLQSHPTAADTFLAIEVADSSLQLDRTTKAELYAEAGIADYWVVNLTSRCIHVMREVGPDRRYGWQRTVTTGDQLSPLARPAAVLDITELFGQT